MPAERSTGSIPSEKQGGLGLKWWQWRRLWEVDDFDILVILLKSSWRSTSTCLWSIDEGQCPLTNLTLRWMVKFCALMYTLHVGLHIWLNWELLIKKFAISCPWHKDTLVSLRNCPAAGRRRHHVVIYWYWTTIDVITNNDFIDGKCRPWEVSDLLLLSQLLAKPFFFLVATPAFWLDEKAS